MTAVELAQTGSLPQKRKGAIHWWRSYTAMLRWEITNMRLLLPITILVQAISGAGIVLGFGLLIPAMEPATAKYLSTGAVVVTLILVGLVLGPQLVAQQRMSGSYDFMWSLPVPRTASSAAWLSLNTLIAVPGMVAALVAAALRYDIAFDINPGVVPAVLFTLITGTLLGYAIAHAIPNPEVTMVVSQVMIFVIFGFSPISFPAENLPGWIAGLHRYLPFEHMANTVRGSLVDGLATDIGHSYLVLSVWAVLATTITAAVLGRRG